MNRQAIHWNWKEAVAMYTSNKIPETNMYFIPQK